MGLTSFFRRQSADSPDDAAGASADSIAAARTRARRRLIGAVVLLGIGVIGFPLLFETQPRPIPVDIPIDIPPREGAPALGAPPKAQGQAQTPAAASRPGAREAQREAARETPRAASPVIEEEAPAATAATTPTTAAAERPQPVAARAASTPSSAPTSAADASTASSRFVVQVGAFAESDKARETRSKVEGLGLKSYTQVVDTADGKRTRVRVGPYPSRDEADRAAAKLRSGGLTAAILEL
jgi:DedD protein